MAYFALLAREGDNAPWTYEFGDHDQSAVEYERDDYRAKGYKARNLKVVRFERIPSQRQVEAHMRKLNGGDA